MTAEEFVVEELKKTREEVIQAHLYIDNLKHDFNEIQEKYDTLYELVDSIMVLIDGNKIRFDSIWEEYDKSKFDYLKDMFPNKFFNNESEGENND